MSSENTRLLLALVLLLLYYFSSTVGLTQWYWFPIDCVSFVFLSNQRKTSISVSFRLDNNGSSSPPSYTLQWKEQSQPSWDATIQSRPITSTDTVINTSADDLQPGTTYCLRLYDNDTQQCSAELIVDTEQVGCTPGQKSGCACIISWKV